MATYGSIPISSTPESGSGGGGGLEFISRAKDRLQSDLGTRKPWKEMTNIATFTMPTTLTEASSRIQVNLAYFRMNYTIIILLILFLSLLWHPISLVVFILMMSLWLFFYFSRDDEPLVIYSRTIDDRVVLVVLSIATIVALFLTDATVNIIVSVFVGVVLVLGHAALRMNEDLFVVGDDDVEDIGQLPLNNDQPSV